MRIRTFTTAGVTAVLALGVAACGSDDNKDTAGGGEGGASSSLSGTIKIDGSSTVFPFGQAAAELFQEKYPKVRVTVGQSGTGGGFEKFCRGETDISQASRPIKPDEEAPACEEAGIGFGQLTVANDGIAVVTNKSLDAKCLTTDQLKSIWNKGSKVVSLKDVDPKLSGTKLSLFGPGTDSGTFDYFTDEINGEEGVTREDYEASEDDNQLVTGVEGSAGGMGYFGFSYYEAQADKLNLIAVDAGDGCVEPSTATIQDGSYKPLSRPLFVFPSATALKRPEVKAYLEFIIENQEQIATAAKMVPLTPEQVDATKTELAKIEAAA